MSTFDDNRLSINIYKNTMYIYNTNVIQNAFIRQISVRVYTNLFIKGLNIERIFIQTNGEKKLYTHAAMKTRMLQIRNKYIYISINMEMKKLKGTYKIDFFF